MARMVSRTRQQEGRGIGERMAESAVFIVIAVVIAFAARWYFFVYQKSPQVAVQSFFGAVNSGNVDTQYNLLTSDAKAAIGSKNDYDDKFPLAHGFSARMANVTVTKMTEAGDTADADLSLAIRKNVGDQSSTAPGSSLTSAGTDSFTEHLSLKKESDGWKIALDKAKLSFLGTARTFR
jgi:hypothetical protein